jgi:hypothetical protein
VQIRLVRLQCIGRQSPFDQQIIQILIHQRFG